MSGAGSAATSGGEATDPLRFPSPFLLPGLRHDHILHIGPLFTFLAGYGLRPSGFRAGGVAPPTQNGLDDPDLFASFADDQAADLDDALQGRLYPLLRHGERPAQALGFGAQGHHLASWSAVLADLLRYVLRHLLLLQPKC
jgi:hypothetical protein